MPAPYGLTDSSEVVSQYILGLIKNGLASISVPGIQVADSDIWYGDAAAKLLPRTPAIAVIPGPEKSVYNGVGGRPVMYTFQTIVMVYFGKVQDVQLNLTAANNFTNALKGAVHASPNLGGNVIDCYCVAVDPGVAIASNALLEASRMTFQSRSKVVLNP